EESVLTRYHGLTLDLYAPYIAEVARQEAIDLFGHAAYTDGYRVCTTVDSHLQASAQEAVVKGLLDYDERHGYRGPEQRFEASGDPELIDWQEKLRNIPTLGGLEAVAVIEVADQSARVLTEFGTTLELGWDQGLSGARPYINEDAR